MDPRKLIKLGNSSYVIALPKNWIEKSGLRKGDSIYTLPNSNGELVLAPGPQSQKKENVKKLNFSRASFETIRDELMAAYTQNADLLEITGFNGKNKKFIKEIIGRMMNFEIVHIDENKIIAKDFLDINEIKLDSFVRKIDNSIRSMFDDIIDLTQKSTKKAKILYEMYDTDHEINRYYLLITRILFKGIDNPYILTLLKHNSKQLFNYWWVAYNLEHIADWIKRATKVIAQNPISKQNLNDINKTFSKIKEIYLDCLNAFHKSDISLAKESLKVNRELRVEINKIIDSGQHGIYRRIISKLYNIIDSIHRINKVFIYESF